MTKLTPSERYRAIRFGIRYAKTSLRFIVQGQIVEAELIAGSLSAKVIGRSPVAVLMRKSYIRYMKNVERKLTERIKMDTL